MGCVIRRDSSMSTCSDSSGFLSVDAAMAASVSMGGGRPSPTSTSSSPIAAVGAATADPQAPGQPPSVSPRGSLHHIVPSSTLALPCGGGPTGAPLGCVEKHASTSPLGVAGIGGGSSSGCASDAGSASADSLEQDLHKLSLAVTEQALE